jgi:hypothetical protein
MRSGTQQEVLTEKEVMSRKYNEQMQKQMGWNNPFEVGLAQDCTKGFIATHELSTAPAYCCQLLPAQIDLCRLYS